MTPTNEPLEVLAAYRPTDEFLDRAWPPGERARMRDRIRHTTARADGLVRVGRAPHRHRRQWSALAGVAAAGAAALLVVQLAHSADGPAGSAHKDPSVRVAPAAAVAPLRQLESAAQAAPSGPVVGPGQFRHLLATGTYATEESWTAYDGRNWARTTFADGKLEGIQTSTDKDPKNLESPSPRFLTTLPTNPDQLEKYLLARVCGYSSRDEAMFNSIGNLLMGGYAPHALRVAAIEVLERTKHVTTHWTQDTAGRRTLRVDFIDYRIRPDERQSLLFDPATSAMIGGETLSPGEHYTVRYSEERTVDSVPADILAAAVSIDDQDKPHPPGESPAPPTHCTWDKPGP
jgi:hypothetical protein